MTAPLVFLDFLDRLDPLDFLVFLAPLDFLEGQADDANGMSACGARP